MLYKVGDRTEPSGTPACISLAVNISPSTKTLNFRRERNELMSLIKLVGNSSSDNLYSKPGCHVVSKAFSISRQRPVSNNREVFSLRSVLRARCHGKIVLLVQAELQEGDVGWSRHA
jgi:hypothetical protein